MSEQLTVIEQGRMNPIEIFGGNGIDPVIDKIEREVRSRELDISTPQGRKDIASLAYKVARSKTTLDAMGKSLTDDAREKISSIDAERRKMRTRLDALRDDVRSPLTAWEDKEKDRIKAHEGALSDLEKMGSFDTTPPSVDVLERIDAMATFHVSRDWEEFSSRAGKVCQETRHELSRFYEELRDKEAKQLELDRARKEVAAREARAHDEEVARKAAEKAKAEAEARAQAEKVAAHAAEERRRAEDAAKIRAAEKAKAEAEQKAVTAAKKERDRIEKEKAERERAEKARAENIKHCQKINDEAVTALLEAGLSDAAAKIAIDAISSHRIAHVKIIY